VTLVRSAEVYRRIYAAIKKIPCGRVATYAQIARMAGLPGHARQVGYALRILKNDSVPWQRIINAQGKISEREPRLKKSQRAKLAAEGIAFNAGGRISLPRYQWKPYFD